MVLEIAQEKDGQVVENRIIADKVPKEWLPLETAPVSPKEYEEVSSYDYQVLATKIKKTPKLANRMSLEKYRSQKIKQIKDEIMANRRTKYPDFKLINAALGIQGYDKSAIIILIKKSKDESDRVEVIINAASTYQAVLDAANSLVLP